MSIVLIVELFNISLLWQVSFEDLNKLLAKKPTLGQLTYQASLWQDIYKANMTFDIMPLNIHGMNSISVAACAHTTGHGCACTNPVQPGPNDAYKKDITSKIKWSVYGFRLSQM